jgi:hypothetical protein
VQVELTAVREKAKHETEEALVSRCEKRKNRLPRCSGRSKTSSAKPSSQQLQGEVQELALEGLLRQKFPSDAFDPVPKGEFGGDLIQHVVGPTGQICGSILCEAKRTKN